MTPKEAFCACAVGEVSLTSGMVILSPYSGRPQLLLLTLSLECLGKQSSNLLSPTDSSCPAQGPIYLYLTGTPPSAAGRPVSERRHSAFPRFPRGLQEEHWPLCQGWGSLQPSPRPMSDVTGEAGEGVGGRAHPWRGRCLGSLRDSNSLHTPSALGRSRSSPFYTCGNRRSEKLGSRVGKELA